MVFVLTTDTIHHRYFINKLIFAGIGVDKVYFEETSVISTFKTGPFYEFDTVHFEREKFFEYDCFKNKENFPLSIKHSCLVWVNNINNDKVLRDLEDESPEIGIVFGTRKISKKIIDKFSFGLINVHRGIVDRYKGLDSDLWAIYHDDFNNIGTTIHMVDENLDSGNIIQQKKLILAKDMKVFQLRYYTTLIAVDLIIDAFRDYNNGILETKKQENDSRYYSFMPLELKKVVDKKFNKYIGKL